MKLMQQIRQAGWAERRAEGGAESYLIERFARTETPAERTRRIAQKKVDTETAEALRRLWAA